MKTKLALALGILILLVVPMISADVTTPGQHSIPVTNKITNINDFQDYVFFVGPDKDNLGPGLGMCGVQVIESDGSIPDSYKFCFNSVYAIKKSEFNQSQIDSFNEINPQNSSAKWQEYLSLINSDNVKLVIQNVDSYVEVSDASTQKSIENKYTIDLNIVKTTPDKINIEKNNLIYFYIIAPIIALISIISIIIFRRKK